MVVLPALGSPVSQTMPPCHWPAQDQGQQQQPRREIDMSIYRPTVPPLGTVCVLMSGGGHALGLPGDHAEAIAV